MIDSAVSFREDIWKDGEFAYEAAYGFAPNVYTYLHDDEQVRPGMIVVPGGGYCMVCNVEGEPVAEYFYNLGMNVVVLTYTTDITMSVPLHDQPMSDLSRAIRLMRSDSRFRMDPEKISIIGFSAGGHVCASVHTHYQDIKDPDPALNQVSNRPDGVILGYPVITSGEFTHIYSIWALIGRDADPKELEYYSLEKQVHKDMAPCFLWQTVTDDLVPVENSMMYAESCRKAGVPYAYFAFPNGPHGLSLHNERVMKGDFGEPYTFEQTNKAVEAVRDRKGVRVSDQRRTELMMQFYGNPEGKPREGDGGFGPMVIERPVYRDVQMWPKLAEEWLIQNKLLS